ncbi:DegT/DnrJ/EryC1/StrS family aminotransferase [Turicimonas muris]|uniref:DegT/DnrJ/EryC1/StrS family aminotransferase n=1 Tax=Turicimonas muris TaxID=1796652 RepID=UPI00248C6BFF|nr:DegT/DnrJ/EryC1/StrS family aminotransferase [Turicimonas muris]
MAIYVTKPALPNIDSFLLRVRKIFEREVLTNQGPEVLELEGKIKNYLGVDHFHYVTNGTIALQLALEGLGIRGGEVITTPFSYVATTSAILWQRCKPVFVDIEINNFTLDPEKIQEAITPETKAIMPVHVFGYACEIEKINKIAKENNLKVIYDAAHAFGSSYKHNSLASFGDVSTLSFHATKLFHTIEGGAIVTQNNELSEKLDLIKRFGHYDDEHFTLGINGKQSEFNAAMGIELFPELPKLIAKRKKLSEIYDEKLRGRLGRPQNQSGLDYNYSYYPVLFDSEQDLLNVFQRLNEKGIFPRRYFFPSLNKLPYLEKKFECPNSEDISKRIACLPLFPDLDEKSAIQIAKIIVG